MKALAEYLDVHTHRTDAGPDAIISVAPGHDFRPDRHYSVGIHPWDSDGADIDTSLVRLAEDARRDCVVAIGETGLDGLRGAPIEVQEQIFRKHVELSEQLGKPLIIHAVKATDRLVALRRELRPTQPWIIHGFRGKPQLARQLLSQGFALSLGEHFNPATAAIIPADRLYTETDTSALPIDEIRRRVVLAREDAATDTGAGTNAGA